MWQSFKNLYHLAMAVLANIFYGFPSKNLVVIGVTGTDGKTTTVGLIYHILYTSGLNVSMVSTVGAIINGKTYDVGFHVTTPSSWKLQKFLKMITRSYTLDAKRYLVLEVTSHALDQYRVWGIDFTVGVLTNVTHEHLDYHKSYENYVKTKAKLLQMAKVAVVNRDDESYSIISKLKTQNSKLLASLKLWRSGQGKSQSFITYGIKNKADITTKNFPFNSGLVGEFNKYNILAASAACRALGVKDEIIRKAIASFKLPVGRMEVVYDDKFRVMIDFAHTPNALEKVLPEVKSLTKGKLIHVFGAAGKRDSSKRSLMGQASAKYADVIILTAEDPRSESVEKIMEEIESGITIIHNSKFIIQKIPDRQEAITTAIAMAKKGDVILITGKGHEQSMNYGRGEVSWSEHQVVEGALSLL